MGRNDNIAFKAEETNVPHTVVPANEAPVDPALGKISGDNTATGFNTQEGVVSHEHTSAKSKIKGAAANAAAAAGHAVNVASEALHYHTGTLSAIDLLIHQHREAATLLHKALATEDPASRFHLVEKVTDSLLIHMRLEEELFYPTAAAECPGEQKFVEQSKDEHREAKELIAKLLRMNPADVSFRPTLQELTKDIEEHVEKEESDLLPTAKKSMNADALKKLGERMHERHGELSKQKKPREMAFMDIHK